MLGISHVYSTLKSNGQLITAVACSTTYTSGEKTDISWRPCGILECKLRPGSLRHLVN